MAPHISRDLFVYRRDAHHVHIPVPVYNGGWNKEAGGGDNKWRQIKEQENSVSRLMIDTSFGIDRQ